MANTIKIKRSAVPAKVPTTGDLALGELALNTYDGKLYTKKDNGAASIVEIGAGAAGATDTQEFTSSSTWTKPAGASFVLVEAWGAGGGGGSGRRGAASTSRSGGSGGGGGAYVYRMFKATELGSTVTVTIGAGGTGGAAITANDTDGNAGTAGGDTTFGSLLTAYGGGNGLGGTAGVTEGAGGGGTLGRPSTSTGGAPLFDLSSGTAHSNAFGGGTGGGTARGGSSGFGGGGGARTNSVLGIPGGSSTYGGAGGNSGHGITTQNVGVGTSPAVGVGLYGSGGTTGASNLIAVANVSSTSSASPITYGNSLFVEFISNGFVASSSDGIAWTAQATFLPIAQPDGLLYDGTRWLAWTLSEVYTATNLSSWTLEASIANAFTSIAYYSGTYVAVSSSGSIRTSTDRITWTSQTSGTTQNLSHVIHDGTRWVVVGAAGVSLTSTDATTWTLVTTGSAGNWYQVASTGTTMVATSSQTPFAWRSTDSGATWSSVSTTLSTNGRIIYAGSQFIISRASIISTSAAGATWTTQTDGTSDSYGGIAYSGSLYFVASSTSNANTGIRSTDGVTWNASTLTALEAAGGAGGAAPGVASGGGGGGGSLNGYNSGAGGNGTAGLCRVYSW